LLGGAAGDRYACRRLSITGVLLFGIASLACAVAPTLILLLLARFVQGASAAMLMPNRPRAILGQSFTDGTRIVTASDDKTARLWAAILQTMSAKGLLAEVCTRLAGLTKLTRDEMRLAGYPDSQPQIDVCNEAQR
jgi:MFS family permease